MKKLFLLCIAAILAFSVFCFVVSAEETLPGAGTYACNIVFDNQVYLEYAVNISGIDDMTGAEVGVLIWRDENAEHIPETAVADLKPFKTQTIGKVECHIVKYTDLSAKEMTDIVYSQPYVKYNGTTYYGKIKEYSICKYAERKLGLVEGVTGTTNENLRAMIRDMLHYGARAQIYFGYKTDKLATDILKNRVIIKYDMETDDEIVANPNPATLEYSSGKYTLKNPERKGFVFGYWADKNNEWHPVTEIDSSAAKTIELAAVWFMEKYTITYNGTMGVLNDNSDSYTVLDSVTLQPLEKYDYDFVGWRITNEDGQWEAIEEIPAGSTGNVVLTAEWKLKPEFEGLSYVVDDNYFLPNGQNFCIFLGVNSTNDITKLEIPTVFNHIQAGALKYCSQLEELTLPFLGSDYTGTAGSYLGYVFGAETALGQNDYIPQSLKKVTVNGSGRIGINAFRDCTSLTDIVVSGTSWDIGQNAYLGCTSLVSLTTPVYMVDAMIYQGKKDPYYQTDFYYGIPGSFDRKNNTASWESESNLDIPINAFETLHINGGNIGNRAFYNNLGIKHLIIEGVDVIRNYAFYCLKNMETLTLHEGLIQIQDGAFMRCNNQKFNELIIPNSVTKLGGCDYVRMANDGNVWYEGPAETSDFREGPFQFCGWLSKIVIGDGVESIPSACFNRTNASPSPELELTLGKNVRMIGPLAFYGTAGALNETDCRISKLINNSVHKELIVYAHAASREDIGMTTLLDALHDCDNPPEKIYLGIYYMDSYEAMREYDALEWNGVTVEKARSYTKFEIVVYSYYNPYENGKAVDGFTYWHGTDPYFWITKQYETPVMWEKP